MMNFNKILFSILAVIFTSSQLFAQNTVKAPSRDLVMLQTYYNNWAQAPDSLGLKNGFHRGASAYFMYDFPFSNSNFSFAPGLGVGAYNYYFKKHTPILGAGNDQVVFQPVDTSSSTTVKGTKISTASLEAPFELRFFADKLNRNRGLKVALGLKVGYLINAHSKQTVTMGTVVTKNKVSAPVYFSTWSFTPTVRIGWGNVSVFGQYALSQQFATNRGPEVYPWAVGITLSGM